MRITYKTLLGIALIGLTSLLMSPLAQANEAVVYGVHRPLDLG